MKKYIYILGWLVLSLASCNEESIGQYPIDSIPPGPVTDVQVKEAFGGGVVLSYKIPDDIDLLGVKAYYTLDTGRKMEVMVSMYATEIKIEGFAKEEERTIQLCAVDRSRNESQPVQVKVTPKRSAIYDVFESVKVFNDFGGIQLQWNNPEEKDVIVMVSKPVKEGSEIKEGVQNFYSSAKEGIGYIRGFPAEEQAFSVEVSDQWGNRTDMMTQMCLPLYEEQVDGKTYWKRWNPTDIPYKQFSGNNYVIEKMWDGITMYGTKTSNFFHTPAGENFPIRFTFDMQQVYKLSRFKLYQRGDKWVYTHGNPHLFTIYGSLTDKVSVEGGENEWIKLGDFESIKPSGLSLESYTPEDLEKGSGGEDYTFPIDLSVPVRYIRFDIHKTWGGTEMIHISELNFWGEPIK